MKTTINGKEYDLEVTFKDNEMIIQLPDEVVDTIKGCDEDYLDSVRNYREEMDVLHFLNRISEDCGLDFTIEEEEIDFRHFGNYQDLGVYLNRNFVMVTDNKGHQVLTTRKIQQIVERGTTDG
jgi:hypothetical protein